MISINSSKTFRNGLSFNNKVGIFETDGHPSALDTGVPKGSICIDYSTPALWHKNGDLTSDWVAIGTSAGFVGTGINTTFESRDGREFTVTDGLISAIEASLKTDFNEIKNTQYFPMFF